MDLLKHIRIEKGSVHVNGTLKFSHEESEFRVFARSLYKYHAMDYAKFYKMSPLSKLGFLASEILLMGMDTKQVAPENISLIIANASSSLHTDRIYQDTQESKPSPAIFVYTLPNIVIGEICIRNGFKGEGFFFIQESFDKEFIFEYADELLMERQTTLCVAGWVEIDMEGDYLADLSLLK